MQLGRLAFTAAYKSLRYQGASAPTPFKVFFISVMSDLKTRSMNNEMEKNRGDAAPHPLDAEEVPSCNRANETDETECTELEERIRRDCRRTCRRNFWIELFKSAAKIAGVVLAALGLSSFNEEN